MTGRSPLAGRERSRLAAVATHYDSRADFDHHLLTFGAHLILRYHTGGSLLELGCANGVMTQVFVETIPDVTVVEGSPQYAAETSRWVGDRATIHVRLFEDYDPVRTFDAVVMASVLEHVMDPVELLRRAASWLTPAGRLHVIVPNAGSLHRRIGVAMGLLPRPDALSERDHLMGHRRVYDAERLRAHVREAGLTIDHWEGILLKPLSNAQMQAWDPAVIAALFEVGRDLPDYCAQLYARVRR